MKVGILGTGFGVVHTEIYTKLMKPEDIYVFGRKPEKLKELQERLSIHVVTDIMDIMDNDEIELVDICLPTPLHKEYAIMALNREKHVFCETPVTYTLEDAREMQDAARKNKKKLMVDLFIRFDYPYTVGANYAREKKHGAIKKIQIQRNTAPIWGELGLRTIVKDLMIHDIDFVSQLLGTTDVIDVAAIESQKGRSVLSALLTYDSAVAEINASSMMPFGYPFTVSYEIIYEQAIIRLFQEFGETPGNQAFTLFADGKREELPLLEDDCYYNAIKYTLQILDSDELPIHDISHAIRSLELAGKINLAQK